MSLGLFIDSQFFSPTWKTYWDKVNPCIFMFIHCTALLRSEISANDFKKRILNNGG